MYYDEPMKRLLPLVALLLIGAGCVSVERLPEPAAPPASRAAAGPHEALTVIPAAVNGTDYVIIRQKRRNVRFTLTRPDPEDPEVLLAVPGTYTSPNDTPEGFIVLDGEIIQAKERQGWDGAVVFRGGLMQILQTDGGKTLTRDFLEKSIAPGGGSLMQAHLLVYDGAAQPFKEQPATFRRALAKIGSDDVIVESLGPIDLDTFAADLVLLHATDAVNLDMGTWSAGWYRTADGGRRTLGIPHENAARQSNWVVFLL